MVVTAAATAGRDLHWLTRNVAPEARVPIDDVTNSQAVLGVMGPEQPRLAPASLGYRSRQ